MVNQSTYSPDGSRILISVNGHEPTPAWATTAIGLAAILW